MTRKMKLRENRGALWDGDEPDDFHSASRQKSFDRKLRQLCAQVQRTLAFLLESECIDECLQGFFVESVSPHPAASCLLVVLRQWDPDRLVDFRAVVSHLAEVKGYWRSEIGSAINRKKTPDLVFQVLLAGDEQ